MKTTKHGRLARWYLAILMASTLACSPLWAQTEITTANMESGTIRSSEPITLNFANADIEAVARTMAVITGRNVVVDPRVRGQMNLVTDKPVLPAVAFDQFLAALRLQGFTMVKAAGLYKVVPEADAKLQSDTVRIGPKAMDQGKAGGNHIETQIFRLNYENGDNLLPILRPLISPNNTINYNPGNNSLVITDYADNLRRMAQIIASMDNPAATDIEIIQLRYAIASDLVPIVQKLISAESTGNAPRPASAAGGTTPAALSYSGNNNSGVVLLAEPRSNAIIVRANNSARLSLVRSLVQKLDQQAVYSTDAAHNNIHVVHLKNADAARLAITLRAALAADLAAVSAAAAGTQANTDGATGNAATYNTSTSDNANANAIGATSTGSSSAQATSSLTVQQPSTGGQIQADPATNSLIITAPEPQYRQIRTVIDKLDSRRAQVMVEALIVEVNVNKLAEFGVQWQTNLTNSGNNTGIAAGTNSSINGSSIIDIALGIANNAYSSLTLPTGFNLAVAPSYNGKYYLGALANFLENAGDANVLSAPNLMTLDNEEARIVIGKNVPFVTGSYATSNSSSTVNPFTTVERQDVGLTLRVRPQISENGTIKMTVYQEASSIDSSTSGNTYGPSTNKRSIESTVLVDDGSIVALGGLMEDNYSLLQDKVPLLGDIPYLGALFRSENRIRKKTNLLVFLRPEVMRDSDSTETFSLNRYEAMRALQQQTQPADNVLLNSVSSAPVMPPSHETIPAAAARQQRPPANMSNAQDTSSGISIRRDLSPITVPQESPRNTQRNNYYYP